MDFLFLLGRILFGGYFVRSGIMHFRHRAAMVGYAQAKGVPSADLAIPATGILILAGGLGIVFGVYVRIAVLALVVFLIPVTFMMHAYWKDTDPAARMASQVNYWKNVALVGASLLLLAIPQPWAYALFA